MSCCYLDHEPLIKECIAKGIDGECPDCGIKLIPYEHRIRGLNMSNMIRLMEPFWIVMADKSTMIASVRHPSRSAADQEAKRLALEHSGIKFYVLKAVESVKNIADPFEVELVP